MKDILILIPVWKRPEIFRICAENLVWFSHKVKHRIRVLVIMSPEDPKLDKLFKIVTRNGFDFCYVPNLPVSDKLNEGIRHAMENYTFDYLMNFGSDDLIHPDILNLYDKHMEKNTPVFGINNLYFYNRSDRTVIHYHTYNNLRAIGAGRMINHHVVRVMLQKKMPLYEPGLNRGLDNNSIRRIIATLYVRDVVLDAGRFPYIVDIKSGENINGFSPLLKLTNRIFYVKPKVLKKEFAHVLF